MGNADMKFEYEKGARHLLKKILGTFSDKLEDFAKEGF